MRPPRLWIKVPIIAAVATGMYEQPELGRIPKATKAGTNS
jgi:hypothetical protein